MTILGRYELRDKLGQGGFATVYRGWDPRLRREVAVKALSLEWVENQEIAAKFLGEAQRLANLHHPNIVTVFDVGGPEERPFFAMELLEGHTLAQFLTAGRRLDLRQVLDLVMPLAAALDALHRERLVHRDVKPSNVMLTRHGRVVLMDLGIARAMDAEHTRSSLFFTPEWAAPEQVQGLPAGPAADIYALGVIAYQMLAGRPPFVGDTAHVLYAQAHVPPPPLWELQPGLPGAVYAVVDGALAKDPARRPATAGTFAAALRDAAGTTAEAEAQRFGRTQRAALGIAVAARPERAQPRAGDGAPPSRAGADAAALFGGSEATQRTTTGGRSGAWPKVAGGIAAGMVALAVGAAVLLGTRGGGAVDLAAVNTTPAATPPAGAAAAGDNGGSTRAVAAAGNTVTPGGAAVSVTVASGEPATLSFPGKLGQIVSLQVSDAAIGPADAYGVFAGVSIIDGDGKMVGHVDLRGKLAFLGPLTLPGDGAYSLRVIPFEKNAGSLTLRLYDVPKTQGTITPAGQPAAVMVKAEVPGERPALAFSGARGQTISLQVTDAQFGPADAYGVFATVALYDPDGKDVTHFDIREKKGFVGPITLADTGTYRLVVIPTVTSTANTGAATLALYDVPANGGTIAAARQPAAVKVTTTIPGEQAALSFTGARGQTVSLQVTEAAFGPNDAYGVFATVALINPDGKELGRLNLKERKGFLGPITLPDDGTYRLLVVPTNAATGNTGSATVALYDVPANEGTLVAARQPATVTVTAATPGEQPVRTFRGTKGQIVSLQVTDADFGPNDAYGATADLLLSDPDGKVLARQELKGKKAFLGPITLPDSGVYRLQVVPLTTTTANLGAATLALYDVPRHEAVIGVGAAPAGVLVSLTVPGEQARLTFAGTQGQSVNLTVSDTQFGPNDSFGTTVTVSIVDPDGKTLVSRDIQGRSGTTGPVALSQSGTYTVVIAPLITTTANTGSATVALPLAQ